MLYLIKMRTSRSSSSVGMAALDVYLLQPREREDISKHAFACLSIGRTVHRVGWGILKQPSAVISVDACTCYNTSWILPQRRLRGTHQQARTKSHRFEWWNFLVLKG